MTAPIRITLTLEGEIVIDRILDGIESRVRDLTPAWPAVIAAFRRVAAAAFASEGASTGAVWAPLKASTQSERRRLGFGPAHPILKRTGTLERSLTLGEGGYSLQTPTRLELGSNVEYFKYHQSTRPRKHLPRRPIQISADERTEMFRSVRLYLTGRDVNAPRRGAIG